MKRILTTLSQKWPEYLLEILVITMGILGAFALNNWNENIKEKAIEQKLIKQLITDYTNNLEQLDQKIEMRKEMISSAFNILKAIDNPEDTNRDSLIYDLSSIVDDPTFDPIENDFNNSNSLRYVSNPELNKLLSNWTSEVVAVNEIEKQWTKMAYSDYSSLLNKSGISRDVLNTFWNRGAQPWLLDNPLKLKLPIGKSSKPKEVIDIVNIVELEGVISYALALNHAANEQSLGLKRRINKILDLLKKELQ